MMITTPGSFNASLRSVINESRSWALALRSSTSMLVSFSDSSYTRSMPTIPPALNPNGVQSLMLYAREPGATSMIRRASLSRCPNSPRS